MPDHVHLLIRPRRDQYSISEILQAIKQPVAVKAITWLRKNNPQGLRLLETDQAHRQYRFWRKGGGYDRNITRTDSLTEVVRYIHANPLRKGLAETPEQWYYSSAAEWSGLREGPLRIDKDDWPVFV